MNELALISAKDLSLIDENSLNAKQLQFILKRTPQQYVKSRPAKGGGVWKYVSGGYVRKCLNLMFGFDWDFEIISQDILYGEIVVKGRLTCRCAGRTIIKTQFGNKEIAYKKQSPEQIQAKEEKIPLSIGNDMKAAATDALKKCAAELGIAADIYNAEDFREVNVDIEENTTPIDPLVLDQWQTELKHCKTIEDVNKLRKGSKPKDKAILDLFEQRIKELS